MTGSCKTLTLKEFMEGVLAAMDYMGYVGAPKNGIRGIKGDEVAAFEKFTDKAVEIAHAARRQGPPLVRLLDLERTELGIPIEENPLHPRNRAPVPTRGPRALPRSIHAKGIDPAVANEEYKKWLK